MRCSSCDESKKDLHPKKSRLDPSHMLYLCNDCTKAKMEPRYLIVLYGLMNGPMSVSDYIVNRRYVGRDILAREVIGKAIKK